MTPNSEPTPPNTATQEPEEQEFFSNESPPTVRRHTRSLTLGFSALLVLVACLIAISFYRLTEIHSHLTTIVEEINIHSVFVQQMQHAERLRDQALQQLALRENLPEQENLLQQFNDAGEQFDQSWHNLLDMELSPDERVYMLQLRDQTRHSKAVQEQLIALARQHRYEEAAALRVGRITAAEDSVFDLLNDMLLLQSQEVGNYASNAYHLESSAEKILLVGGGIILLLGALIGWAVRRYLLRLLGQLADTTERLENSLRSLNLQKLALDKHAIVSITDAQGNITYANDLFTASSLYSRDEVIGQSHRMLNSGQHPPEFFSRLWATITQGEVWHGQVCNRRKDGSLCWTDTTIVPFLDENRQPHQYVAVRTDITPIKEAEARLETGKKELEASLARQTVEAHHQEALFQRLADTAQDAILMADKAGVIGYWNKAAGHIFGYSRDEAVGQPLARLFKPERRSNGLQEAFDRLVQDDGEATSVDVGELVARRRDGGEFPVELSLSATHVSGHWAAICVIRDASERKNLEQLLQDLSATDSLTGIASRHSFDDSLAREVARADRFASPLALIFFDIDDFKTINDRHGRPAGDALLMELAQLIRRNIRGNDYFARWGQDRFALLAVHCDCLRLASKLCELIADQDFPSVGRITASFGLAENILNEGGTAMVERADRALYLAKHKGKNRVEQA